MIYRGFWETRLGFAIDAIRKCGQFYDWLSYSMSCKRRKNEAWVKAMVGKETTATDDSQDRSCLSVWITTFNHLFCVSVRTWSQCGLRFVLFYHDHTVSLPGVAVPWFFFFFMFNRTMAQPSCKAQTNSQHCQGLGYIARSAADQQGLLFSFVSNWELNKLSNMPEILQGVGGNTGVSVKTIQDKSILLISRLFSKKPNANILFVAEKRHPMVNTIFSGS